MLAVTHAFCSYYWFTFLNHVFPTGPGIESLSQASLVQDLFLIMLDVVEYDLTAGNVMLASEAIGAYLEHLES